MDLEKFKAALKYGIAKPHSYNVLITSEFGRIMEDISIMAEDAEIPGRSFATNDMALYGPRRKFPYLETFADLKVTFICSSDFWERIWFEDWMNKVCNPKSGYYAYMDNYARDIVIQQLDSTGKVVYEGLARKAWPVMLDPQPLSYASVDTYHKLGVTFTYERFIDSYTNSTASGDSGVGGSRIPGRGIGGPILPQGPQVPQ